MKYKRGEEKREKKKWGEEKKKYGGFILPSESQQHPQQCL